MRHHEETLTTTKFQYNPYMLRCRGGHYAFFRSLAIENGLALNDGL